MSQEIVMTGSNQSIEFILHDTSDVIYRVVCKGRGCVLIRLNINK